jgi:hypothetical protein
MISGADFIRSKDRPRTPSDSCDDCAIAAAGQRRFLRGVTVMVAGALAALSASPVSVAALEGLDAFSLDNPHQNTPLRWQQDEQEFRWPKHHSTFTPDAIFIDRRATRSIDGFAVQHVNSDLAVDLNMLYRENDDPDLWKAALIAL